MAAIAESQRQLACALAVFFAAVAPLQADWPQWRGPNRDGVVHGVKVPATWPPSLKELWKIDVGEGVASPVAGGNRVYVFTRQKEDERAICLDISSGRELWRTDGYAAPYEWQLGEGNFSKGPRSTPVLADGKLYTYGVSGILSCLDAGTGATLWRHECLPVPPYASNSPLVTDGLCLVHYGDFHKNGGLTAFDAVNGQRKWCFAEGSNPMCVSPIVVDLAGQRQIVTSTLWEFVGVSVATGEKLWGQKASFGLGTRCVTPIQYKDLLIFADYQGPPWAFRLEKTGQGIAAKEVWHAEGISQYYTTPVIAGNRLFGMSTRKVGCFFCLDADSGKTIWESDGRQGENASILRAGNVFLILTSSGRLIVVDTQAASLKPLTEYQVSETRTYAHPIFLGDRILIKDEATLRCLAIESQAE
ncbi:MAG TPA: PQQ-binding-like beta-propeller repeat protein [Pirellulaceae bacterium]|nr:PQQ-binding-like beta-propeller repeat protein [Pirellulaceae bacterium]